MFIKESDYVQIGKDALQIIQKNELNRAAAEDRAISEVSAYLRSRYDVNATFAKVDNERDLSLVGIVCNIALFYMVCSLPGRMGYDMRKELYEKSIEFLKDVQKGFAQFDIPAISGPDGEEDYNNPISFNCGIRNKYDW